MTRKPIYSYDIDKIQDMENKGMSIRAIARKMGWPEENTQQWIKRNYNKIVKYIKKK